MTRKKSPTRKKAPTRKKRKTGNKPPSVGDEYGLSDQQRLAVDIYLGLIPEHADCEGSLLASYKAAGYTAKHAAQGSWQLFRKPKVLRYIRAVRQRAQQFVEMTQADIVRGYEDVLQADYAALLRKVDSALTLRDLEEWTVAERNCIDSIEMDGDKVKVRLVSKAEARERLGKHLGMWPNRFEGTINEISANDRIMAAHYRLSIEEYVERAAAGTLPEAPALPAVTEKLRHH